MADDDEAAAAGDPTAPPPSCSITDLPRDAMLEILSRADPQSACALAGTCRRLRAMTNLPGSEKLWSELCERRGWHCVKPERYLTVDGDGDDSEDLTSMLALGGVKRRTLRGAWRMLCGRGNHKSYTEYDTYVKLPLSVAELPSSSSVPPFTAPLELGGRRFALRAFSTDPNVNDVDGGGAGGEAGAGTGVHPFYGVALTLELNLLQDDDEADGVSRTDLHASSSSSSQSPAAEKASEKERRRQRIPVNAHLLLQLMRAPSSPSASSPGGGGRGGDSDDVSRSGGRVSDGRSLVPVMDPLTGAARFVTFHRFEADGAGGGGTEAGAGARVEANGGGAGAARASSHGGDRVVGGGGVGGGAGGGAGGGGGGSGAGAWSGGGYQRGLGTSVLTLPRCVPCSTLHSRQGRFRHTDATPPPRVARRDENEVLHREGPDRGRFGASKSAVSTPAHAPAPVSTGDGDDGGYFLLRVAVLVHEDSDAAAVLPGWRRAGRPRGPADVAGARAPLLEAALVSPEASRRAAATEMFLWYYLADENERRHPAAASGVNWRSRAVVATGRGGGGGGAGGGGGSSTSQSQSPERAAHNVARVAPVMLSLLFDGWGCAVSSATAWRVGGRGKGRDSSASSTSERVAQTAAVILGHFADSEVNAAAMVRGGALGTLRRALKARRAAVGSVSPGCRNHNLHAVVVDGDPLLRLIRDVMGKLVQDSDAGADFMRTALSAAAR